MNEVFFKMLEAYQTKSDSFEAYARNWLVTQKENPFTSEPLFGLFYKANANMKKWQAKGIDYRISYRRMIEAAREIAELYPLYADAVEPDEEVAAPEDSTKEKEEHVVSSEDTHVLGVVTENQHGFFKKKGKKK